VRSEEREVRLRRAAGIALVAADPSDPAVLLGWRSAYIGRHPGVLAFPGGMVNPGESLLEGALRELSEEALLPIAVAEVATAVVDSFTVTAGRLDYTTFIAVLTEPVRVRPANWENDGFVWLRRSEAADVPADAFHPDVHEHLHRVWR
jgi:8-oxo-dGTP pyrophosphatase MutT (NUDIX family)